jgi:hypothetical protein
MSASRKGFCSMELISYTYLMNNNNNNNNNNNERYQLYWDRTIITNRTISNNRPDITLIDKVKKKPF